MDGRRSSAAWLAFAGIAALLGCSEGTPAPAVEPGDLASAASAPTADPASNARLPLPQPNGANAIGARVYEYSIDLTRDTIASGIVRFHVVNAGTTAHMFIVRNAGSYHATNHLVPGDSTILEVDLAPGEYNVLCAVRDEFDHISEGERRDFTVL